MAEEIKQEEKKCCEPNKALSAIFKVILGLVFLALGVWLVIIWIGPLLTLVKGCLGLFLILAGIITLAIAKE